MSGGMRGVVAGVLGLALLDAAVSTQGAANRVGGLLGAVAKTIEHILSPTVAAIPDLRTHGGAQQLQNASALTGDTGTGAGGAVGTLLPADWTTAPSQLYAT
jgi:hypothetical protein